MNTVKHRLESKIVSSPLPGVAGLYQLIAPSSENHGQHDCLMWVAMPRGVVAYVHKDWSGIRHSAEVDLTREYGDTYASLHAEGEKLRTLKHVVPTIHRLKELKDKKEKSKRDLPALYAEIVSRKARRHTELQQSMDAAAIRLKDIEAGEHRINEELNSLRKESQQLVFSVIGAIVGETVNLVAAKLPSTTQTKRDVVTIFSWRFKQYVRCVALEVIPTRLCGTSGHRSIAAGTWKKGVGGVVLGSTPACERHVESLDSYKATLPRTSRTQGRQGSMGTESLTPDNQTGWEMRCQECQTAGTCYGHLMDTDKEKRLTSR